MTMQFGDIAAAAAAAGTIGADEVLALRRIVWSDGAISEAAAKAILDIDAGIVQPSREWTDFLVEALSVWLVDEQHPQGYIDEVQAGWLIERFSHEGRPATSAEIETVIHCLEKAVSAPAALERFALAQIEQALLARPAPAGITSNEVKQLRRVIFAPGSDHTDGVSQSEAELLFRLKDALLTRDNAPEWQLLFVQGVANFLQGFSLSAPLPRAQEADLEAFMDRPEPGLFGFLSRMGRPRDAMQGLSEMKHMGWHEHLFTDEAAEAAKAAQGTPEHDAWLRAEIDRDGQTDAFEQALLDFLKQG